MKLFIGNKNYSSWSFRVWLTMKVRNIEFEENLRPFDVANDYADFFTFSPTGKVPVLQHKGSTIYESLSILEYLAELYPKKNLWPEEQITRSNARCIANEMHAGFTALRAACPMNMRRKISRIELSEATVKDIHRIETIWTECLKKSGGPYLFGKYSIADGMYAPIVNRFQIYELSHSDVVSTYTKTMTALPAWQEWNKASHAESWVVEIDEV